MKVAPMHNKDQITDYVFDCPGCKCAHSFDAKKWSFNGNFGKPTFSPSLLVTSGCKCSNHDGGDCWCNYEERFKEPAPYKCFVCHSFVENGFIRFLGDCTHELANQTVELTDV